MNINSSCMGSFLEGAGASKFCMARIPWEWDSVSDVVKARDKHDEALEAHAEAGAGRRTVPTQVDVLLVML